MPTSCTGIFRCYYGAVYGRLNVNVALNRPTFAVSEYSTGNIFLRARNAVDGNNDTEANQVDNSCFCSLDEENPWWSVDLGSALAVVSILFTNRGDSAWDWGNVSPSIGSCLSPLSFNLRIQQHADATVLTV